MHLSIVGAGVLGRIYGVRAATSAAPTTRPRVTFVTRPGRLGDTTPFLLEQVNGPQARHRLDAPTRVATIPDDATAVLVAVRFEDVRSVDPDLVALLRAAPTRAPLLVVTPLLPHVRAELEHAVGRGVVPGMPGAVGYIDERDVVRYWLPKVAATLFEEETPLRPAVEDLARTLTDAGVQARLERGVEALDAGTTIAFFPLIAAIDAGGGVDALLAHKDLFSTALEAAKETDALAKKVGRPAPWSSLLTKFVGPFTIKPGIALARKLAPEAVRFVEQHFGPKLHAQHVAMGEAILALGRGRGQEMPALRRLMLAVNARATRV
jgi:2-dehydropantoate 2-reductase